MQRVATDATGEITIAASSATEQQAVALRSDVAYVPLDDGSHVAPSASGFVVTRDVAILDPIGAPARRQRLDQPAAVIALKIGDSSKILLSRSSTRPSAITSTSFRQVAFLETGGADPDGSAVLDEAFSDVGSPSAFGGVEISRPSVAGRSER